MLQLFKCFSQLGLCQSVDATRTNVDAMVTECDATMDSWRKKLELEVSDEDQLSVKNDHDSSRQGRPCLCVS